MSRTVTNMLRNNPLRLTIGFVINLSGMLALASHL